MIVDGVEIMRMIRDGEFEDDDKIKEDKKIFKYNDSVESFFKEDEAENPMMYYYTDKDFASAEFEILTKENKEIDIQAIEEFEFGETEEKTNYENRTKINELIKALKQLDKKIK